MIFETTLLKTLGQPEEIKEVDHRYATIKIGGH